MLSKKSVNMEDDIKERCRQINSDVEAKLDTAQKVSKNAWPLLFDGVSHIPVIREHTIKSLKQAGFIILNPEDDQCFKLYHSVYYPIREKNCRICQQVFTPPLKCPGNTVCYSCGISRSF
jgi:hypothetical protein